MRWQMALYKEMAGKAEDADAPPKVVKRVQEVSAVLYHLEMVSVYESYVCILNFFWLVSSFTDTSCSRYNVSNTDIQ